MQWLSIQNVNTIKNFTDQKWQQMMTKDRKYLKLNKEEEVKIYYLNEQILEYHQVKTKIDLEEDNMVRIVGHFSKKMKLHVCGEFNLQSQSQIN